MEKINLHFFHGFLGLPSDWQSVSQHFHPERYSFHYHNLWEDITWLKEISFQDWSQLKSSQMNSKGIHVGVGYSLGGRLLMHLPFPLFQRLIFIAAHPGLETDQEKSLRYQSDLLWAEKFLTMDWEELMLEWERQEVFKGDKNRPHRKEFNYKRKDLSSVLKTLSLGKQDAKDKEIQQQREKISWIYGSRDKKFSQQVKRWNLLIGNDRIHKLEGSGHSCHFDQPEELSQILKDVMADL